MAENQRELVAALPPGSGHFPCNIRAVSRQIREAGSAFYPAVAGVENFTICRESLAGSQPNMQKARSPILMSRNAGVFSTSV